MKHLLTLLFLQLGLTAFGQISIKETDKSLAKITDNLYASKYEVSNSQYNAFLFVLKNSKQLDKYAIARIDSLKWTDKLSNNAAYAEYYHLHIAYKDYPVVNISYDAALLFCEWLTNEYNASPDRKFNKVKFRLPTEQEWMMAAQGGDNSAIYPWEGKELRNSKGCYMCNFIRPSADSIGIAGNLNDAADITAPVKAYYPNNFGLYNMSGNIAEMMADKGIVKGGSWCDYAENMTILSTQSYDGSAKRTVGFRYFVDIIER